ncbi:MAG: dTDP-4-dehydrorhamnose reductase [Candidatus Omnitrophica bacterium ADurb.Bin292]|nr:MAG: dTDP-4-dehydrorhamnose reductase [Candidatus Omnitrophica bacterium ADurb.Bin292]
MKKKILILGATGMLGHVLMRHLSSLPGYEVYGTARNPAIVTRFFPPDLADHFRHDTVDAINIDSVIRALAAVEPDIVINCIGLIKQLPIANDPLSAITINAQLPHRISLISKTAGARMIHISTDCVFNGQKGHYTENDPSNAEDLYGRTKYLGEVSYPHCITLRTSIIGHELEKGYGLVDWFLAQHGTVRGFTKAIYSGFPTIELARILSDYILPDEKLSGVYHVSSDPISKFDLLKIIAEKYKKQITLEAYDDFVLDRSLNGSRFRETTGYTPPQWPELIDRMHRDYVSHQAWYQKSH